MPNMESFFITPEEFWNWFERDPSLDAATEFGRPSSRPRLQQRSLGDGTSKAPDCDHDEIPANKKMRREGKLRHIIETEAETTKGTRYDIMYGRHRPGKKNKVWEADGYLTLVGQMAYLCTTNGKMLEDPVILDDIDMKSVEDLDEILIGSTEVQVVEISKRRD